MKKVIIIFGIIAMLFGLFGCSPANQRTDELGKMTSSDSAAIKHVESIVVSALEKKDADLLKSVFSKKALTYSSDFDRGIQYIFSLYRGDYVDIAYENHSVDEHLEKGKSIRTISAWCVIRTTEESYTLSWVDQLKLDADPSEKGVYNLQMTKYIEKDYSSYWRVAGINYPDRDIVHKTIPNLASVFCNNDALAFMSLLSKDLISQPETLKNITEILDLLNGFSYSDVGNAWIISGDGQNGKRGTVCVELKVHNKPFFMYFSFDEMEKDKIAVFIISDQYLKDEVLPDEDGIYLL